MASSGRARLPGVLVEQDGIYGALHTLSKAGVVNYLDKPPGRPSQGMPIWGYDFPPGRVRDTEPAFAVGADAGSQA